MDRKLRRRTVATACVFTITILLNPGLASAQDEVEEWEQNELLPILERLSVVIEDDLPIENPFEVSWDFLKGAEGSIYVPFTMTIDPSAFSQPEFALYVFVRPSADPAASTDAAPADAAETVPEDPFQNRTYEDLFFVDVSDNTSDDGQLEVHRAFQAPPGNYDVYVVVRDSVGEDGDPEALTESMVLLFKDEVEVPNFWNQEFRTSSILVARSLDLIDTPLSPEDQRLNPYTIGTTQIIPKRDGNFGKDDALSLLFWVYNPQLTADQSPDVTVEFDFHRVGPAGESFFNRTTPQQFNDQTWPAGLPVTGGLPSGQAVPLGSFPAGDFRLEIKITDNTAGQTLTRDVTFNVSE